jgi:ADP-ribose pyrophosphatase YjhB (NUDIX family)
MPFVRVELAVLAVRDGRLQVLLGRRTGPPHEGSLALPGGVLRTDTDTSLDDACQRVARERLGTPLPDARQLTAVGGPSRDPRAPWALSVVYRTVVHDGQLQAKPGKRLSELRWADAGGGAGPDADGDVDPAHHQACDTPLPLAFDHAELVQTAAQALRDDIEHLRFPPGLLPAPFSLGDLQAAAEAVLGRKLDKSSFRRRIDAAGCVEAVDGAVRTGAFRPAQLYRVVG